MQTLSQREVNLHTHSNYCDHAVGSLADYVKAARFDGRLSVLGFSEHMPVPGDPYKDDMRMARLGAYVAEVRNLAGTASDLKILLGGECEYFPSLLNFYREELLGNLHFDYLLCSIHLYHDRSENRMCYVSRSKDFLPYLTEYVENYCAALESGLFLFGCHPDLYLSSLRDWNDDLKAASLDIIQCAKQTGIPLEVNGTGLRKPLIETKQGPRHPYATEEFFSLAALHEAKLCCNSDAHDPHLVNGLRTEGHDNECFALAAKLGFEYVDWILDDERRLHSVERHASSMRLAEGSCTSKTPSAPFTVLVQS